MVLQPPLSFSSLLLAEASLPLSVSAAVPSEFRAWKGIPICPITLHSPGTLHGFSLTPTLSMCFGSELSKQYERGKMNGWAYQQRALMGGYVVDGVVCPKPRRVGGPIQFHDHMRLLHINSQQTEACDAKPGMELLDIIRMKGSYGSERSSYLVDSSPPFFAGSPPIRASNPVIQDENFGYNNGYPLSPMLEVPSSAHRSGSFVRTNHGSKPAVRIEGFNCRGDCRISGIA